MAHPVPDEAQPGQGSLDQPALGRTLACQHAVVRLMVMADQRAVDDGDPPHRLTDDGERSRPVPCPGPRKPFCRVTHRGEGPLERAHLGRRIAHVLAVPCDPAASRAEPGVLAARREQSAALLAVPGLSHQAMLRVTCMPSTGRSAPVSAAASSHMTSGYCVTNLLRQPPGPGPAGDDPGSGRHVHDGCRRELDELDQLWMVKSALRSAGVPICTW